MKNFLLPVLFLPLLFIFESTATAMKVPERIGEAPLYTQDNGLATPYFTSRGFAIYEKIILWSFTNPNEDSETEIYISRSADTGYALAYVAPHGEEVYEDTSHLPRTTYYFKLRAIRGNEVSSFSGVKSFTTGSKFYHPVLIAEEKSDQTIELKFYDRSYDDISYEVWREPGPEPSLFWTIVASDSGQIITYTDSGLSPGTTYSYRVDARTKGPNSPIYYGVATAVAQTWEEEGLSVPYFIPLYGIPFPQDQLEFDFVNPNENSKTEVYISRSPDSGFELVYIVGYGNYPWENYPWEGEFSPLPRTTYYIKLRAIRGDQVSDFSQVEAFTTGSRLYPPVLTAEATGAGTIELKLYVRSYYLTGYWILNEYKEFSNEWWIAAPDSGQVITIIDDGLQPNTTYKYRVDAYGPNPPSYHEIYYVIATATAQTLDGPWIERFTLVDADTEEDVTDLYDNMVISAPMKLNIRANASEKTSSVVFYLNGKKRTANEAPYAYFGYNKGNYKPGKLPDGHYVLEATAYGDKKGKGEKGNTLTIGFTVQRSIQQNIASEEKVNYSDWVVLYPNPVVHKAWIEISDKPGSNVRLDVVNQLGNDQYLLHDGPLDESGFLKKDLDVNTFKKGIYILLIRINDQVTTKRFFVQK